MTQLGKSLLGQIMYSFSQKPLVAYSCADSCMHAESFERVVCERELETEQNCNILTPTLVAISVFFPFSWVAQPETWVPRLSGTCSSIQRLISNSSDPQQLNRGLGAHSAGCWFSLPHLDSNWTGLQTN